MPSTNTLIGDPSFFIWNNGNWADVSSFNMWRFFVSDEEAAPIPEPSTLPLLYGSSPNTNFGSTLFVIDPDTGTTAPIGDIGFKINGLAYDSTSDVLYGIDGGFGESINNLFRIDRATGAATPIGATGLVNAWGLA